MLCYFLQFVVIELPPSAFCSVWSFWVQRKVSILRKNHVENDFIQKGLGTGQGTENKEENNMSSTGYYELYRRSTIGAALVDALDTLISDGRIEASLAMRVLDTFDRVVAETLKDKAQSKLTFKGHLDTYRFCDDVWTFIIKNCSVKLDNSAENSGNTVVADKLRIVACNFKKTGE